MPIPVQCDCGRQLMAKDEFAGRRTQCPDCGRELIIPSPGLKAASPYLSPDEQAHPARNAPADDLEWGGGPPKWQPARTSGMAVASLVLGLLSFCFSVVTGVPAIILGILGLNQTNRSGGRVTGQGFAIAGLVTGLITTLMLPISVALLLPAVQMAREAARRAQCTNNMKQIGIALENDASEQGHFPPASIRDRNGTPLLSWRVAILPLIGEQALYNEFHLDEPWDGPHNRSLVVRMPKVFACPSRVEGREFKTPYQVFVGPGTCFESKDGTPFSAITDGNTNTILVAEAREAVTWTQPDDLAFDPNGPLPALDRIHAGGCNVLFADGHVLFVRPDQVSDSMLRALITRNGNEAVDLSSLPIR